MDKTLLILEVSQKQNYIFASNKLKDNRSHSGDICYVTDNAFFEEVAGDNYVEEKNMVYSGGGHTILQFESPEKAKNFTKRVTEAAIQRFPNMELFAKAVSYDDKMTPGQNLSMLSQKLEEKKALRRTSFHTVSYGVEELNEMPVRTWPEIVPPPPGWSYCDDFEKYNEKNKNSTDADLGEATLKNIEDKDNFIAVIHIDGNSMGKRVNDIYQRYNEVWENCCIGLRHFSTSIQNDFTHSFAEMVEDIRRLYSAREDKTLPIRPIILAGDDVCFASSGMIGLECARIFLKHLAEKRNAEDGKPYAACAGVALVHIKYPFHRAYDLAEELCSNAKKYGVSLFPDGSASVLDWHIEFGQIKDGLSKLRMDYDTDDGNRMELRPVLVIPPVATEEKYRTYDFFRRMCRAMQNECGKTARSKIKKLRTVFKQGMVETEFFLHDQEINTLLESAQLEGVPRTAFHCCGEESFCRCLLFDAIEMIDHWIELEEEKNNG